MGNEQRRKQGGHAPLFPTPVKICGNRGPRPPPPTPVKICNLSVFWTGKPTKGVPEVVDYAVEDHDRETKNTKVRARHGTQDLYRLGSPRWRTLHPVWGIKYGALRLVLGWLSCPARYPALLYIVQGAGF
jgi:hypothetical protein